MKRLIVLASNDRCEAPIYYSSAKGTYVPLLKTLLMSGCRNSCKYCGLKTHFLRWDTDKLVNVVEKLAKSRVIKGLFLTSTIRKDPDFIVEKEIEVAEKIRKRGLNNFYIHLRLMPGVSKYLVKEAALVADRIGINLEAPEHSIFNEICPDKDYINDVLKRLTWCSELWRKKEGNLKAGIDTQLIIGAVDDNDLYYLKTAEWAYNLLDIRRVYFSRFIPIKGTPLENRDPTPKWRELRLYQASFLIRDYGFTVRELKEILTEDNLLPNIDPKIAYSKIHPEFFPVNLNNASPQEILRIPYIGPKACEKIIQYREHREISKFKDLVKLFGKKYARILSKYVDIKDHTKKLTAWIAK